METNKRQIDEAEESAAKRVADMPNTENLEASVAPKADLEEPVNSEVSVTPAATPEPEDPKAEKIRQAIERVSADILRRPGPGVEQPRPDNSVPPSHGEGKIIRLGNYIVHDGCVYVHAQKTTQLQITYLCPFCLKDHEAPAYHDTSFVRLEERPCPCLPKRFKRFAIFITRETIVSQAPEKRSKKPDNIQYPCLGRWKD